MLNVRRVGGTLLLLLLLFPIATQRNLVRILVEADRRVERERERLLQTHAHTHLVESRRLGAVDELPACDASDDRLAVRLLLTV